VAYTETVEFTWDEGKNAANLAKHGVSFEEARALFLSGVNYLELFDEAHSVDEERFIAIGPISRSAVGSCLSSGQSRTRTPYGSSVPVGPPSERAYYHVFVERSR